MKKISKLLYLILLITLIISLSTNVVSFATSDDISSEQDFLSDVDDSDEYSEQDSSEVIKTIAKVISAEEPVEEITGTVTIKTEQVKIEVIKGDYIGEEFTLSYSMNKDINGIIEKDALEVGDKVIVQIAEDQDGNTTANIIEVVRYSNLITLGIILAISIVIVSGKKGIKNIISILFTFIILIFVLINGISSGNNVYLISILSVILIIGISYIIMYGLNKKALTAILGTFLGVMIAGLLAIIFNGKAKDSGISLFILEDSVGDAVFNFSFKNLLFVEVIIATIGVCMDLVVSLIEKLDNLKKENPDINWKELLVKGLGISKEIIASMTNTLILIFFSMGIGSMLILVANKIPLYELLSYEVITELLISAFSGTIAIIYSVPITTLIYSFINKDRIVYRKEAMNKVDGKRSLKL